MDDFQTHITTGAAVVYAIQWAKRRAWLTWITADSDTLNIILSVIGSAAVALGIEMVGDSSVGWTIRIPPAEMLLFGVIEWGKQIALQQLLYDGIVKKAKPRVHSPRPPRVVLE